jgi:hypothetical protein
MKAIIENGGIYLEKDENVNIKYDLVIHRLISFNTILNIIDISKDEQELRRKMMDFFRTEYHSPKESVSDIFQFGFGSNHMWVQQIGTTERLIFVEF